MLKEGMFIQERYEVISKIGSGGMADVYKAKDHKLNRFVAVKVLKAEFREDKAFVSKFRVEAQSAAGLAHPNIVNVYDVGEEEGIYFIVMELVEGITLKEYVEKKGRLAVREATSIAIQISMGLQAAHQNDIVHRDVKPQNIIISTDGKVKVTDFGIARAASVNTISSSVMGSVHYSSPEQSRGGYSDFKSDIYSLGITMYEMLTGHVPFDGDTTVAIAIKHLQEEMQSPRKYVPDLPKSTVQIIYKCTQKSPDRRYGDMDELIRDLKESLVNPEGDFVQIVPLKNHAQTVVISKDELDQIKQGEETPTGQNEYVPPADNGYDQRSGDQYGNNGYPPYNGYNQGGGYQGGYGNEYYPEDDDDIGVNKKKEKFLTIGSIVIGVIILFIFLALVGNAVGIFNLDFLTGGRTNSTEATTEANSPAADNTDSAAAGGTTGSEPADSTGSDPAASAAEEVRVPDLLGRTRDEATTMLNDLGLGSKFSGEKESSEYSEGQVMEQDPASGTVVPLNSQVIFYISVGQGSDTEPDEQDSQRETGSGMVTVPSVIGESEEAARATLEDLGLHVEVYQRFSSEYPAGTIVEQGVNAGTQVNPGIVVELEVSVGSSDSESSSGDGQSSSAQYACNVKLTEPTDGYNNETAEVELVQDGESKVVSAGTPITFPYMFKYTSDSDSMGVVYIHLTQADGSVKTYLYEDIPFTEVN